MCHFTCQVITFCVCHFSGTYKVRLLFNVRFEDEENLLLLSFQDFKMKKFSPRGKENIVTSLGENLGDILCLIVIVESWSFYPVFRDWYLSCINCSVLCCLTLWDAVCEAEVGKQTFLKSPQISKPQILGLIPQLQIRKF